MAIRSSPAIPTLPDREHARVVDLAEADLLEYRLELGDGPALARSGVHEKHRVARHRQRPGLFPVDVGVVVDQPTPGGKSIEAAPEDGIRRLRAVNADRSQQ